VSLGALVTHRETPRQRDRQHSRRRVVSLVLLAAYAAALARSAAGLRTLGSVARALVMRGEARGMECVAQALATLRSLTRDVRMAEAEGAEAAEAEAVEAVEAAEAEVARAAAAAVAAPLAEEGAPVDVNWTRRVLYKQRFLLNVLPALAEATRAVTAEGLVRPCWNPVGTSTGPIETRVNPIGTLTPLEAELQARAALHLALAGVVCSAPRSAVWQEAHSLMRLLTLTLGSLAGGRLEDAQALAGALDLLAVRERGRPWGWEGRPGLRRRRTRSCGCSRWARWRAAAWTCWRCERGGGLGGGKGDQAYVGRRGRTDCNASISDSKRLLVQSTRASWAPTSNSILLFLFQCWVVAPLGPGAEPPCRGRWSQEFATEPRAADAAAAHAGRCGCLPRNPP
jgi:hypothetical protein